MKNGTLWLDTDGRGIQAHGGSILQHNGIFYWYGENKDTDTHNRSVDFVGFSCYKSRDLLHWENCGLVLSAVNELGHDLHPDSVCERPSVLYNAETQKFVLWFHLDNRRYTRAEVGLAVSDTPTGPFAYMGSQRPGSHDSRDFTAFQDRDGRAYLFCSSDWNATMRVWELDKTYTKLTGSGKEILIDQAREAPALWHSGEKYLMFSSGCTGWSPCWNWGGRCTGAVFTAANISMSIPASAARRRCAVCSTRRESCSTARCRGRTFPNCSAGQSI